MKIDIGKKLRKLRRDKDITQEKLGKKIGVRPSYISKYESGDVTPSLKVIIGLAKTLHVPVDDLLFQKSRFSSDKGISDPELHQKFIQIQDLPEEKKNIIKTYLDGFLADK